MSVCLDISWKSLNKHNEELCGDKVEVLHTEDADIVILADGMGSGVKANILATLTSKILGTMFLNGAAIESCVETIARTLPICQVRQVAYATFSILQIFHDGNAYLVEFDNPSCVFVRDKTIVDYPYEERFIEDKKIREYRFHVKINDCFVLMSDGVIYAGVGELLNFGWTWKDMAQYTLKCTKETLSASRLAAMLSQACYDLYGEKPGDDTTVGALKIRRRSPVNLLIGPPSNPEDVNKMMALFFAKEGKHIVCGGTTSSLAAGYLGKPVDTVLDYLDPEIPPTAKIEGVDLVTEGVITMSRVLTYAKSYLESNELYSDWSFKLDGASQISRLLFEEATDINFYVGRAVNPAHQNPNLPISFNIKMRLIEELSEALKKMGKRIKVSYF